MQSRGMDGHELAQITANGATWIWNLADMYYPGARQLLDFYHAAEHLHKTAAALWTKEIADAWCHERREQLKEGELEGFFTELKRIAEEHTLNDPALDPKRLLNYFETNRNRLIRRGVKGQHAHWFGRNRIGREAYRPTEIETIGYALVASRRSGCFKPTHKTSKRSFRTVLGKLCRRIKLLRRAPDALPRVGKR